VNLNGYALIVVDMIKDNVNTERHGLMDVQAAGVVPAILELTDLFRRTGGRVVFACDSFMEGDFIFRGRMLPHAIRGTGGDMPIPELQMQPSDLFLQKRRMSSFHKTDLDQTLRTWGVHTVVVCGITTNVCVLATAIDAIQNDFYAIIASDACACHDPRLHEMTLKVFEPLQGIVPFKILTVAQVKEELEGASKTDVRSAQ
jgi:nicotinamidase-related amidase